MASKRILAAVLVALPVGYVFGTLTPRPIEARKPITEKRPTIDDYARDADVHFRAPEAKPRLHLRPTRVRSDDETREFGEQPPEDQLLRIELAGGRIIIWGVPVN